MIEVEELKKALDTAKINTLENSGKMFKEATEKSGKNFNSLEEFAFNMQNMIAIMEFQQEFLKELGINE